MQKALWEGTSISLICERVDLCTVRRVRRGRVGSGPSSGAVFQLFLCRGAATDLAVIKVMAVVSVREKKSFAQDMTVRVIHRYSEHPLIRN